MRIENSIQYFYYYDLSFRSQNPLFASELTCSQVLLALRFAPHNLAHFYRSPQYFSAISCGLYRGGIQLHVSSLFTGKDEKEISGKIGIVLWNKKVKIPGELPNSYQFPVIVFDVSTFLGSEEEITGLVSEIYNQLDEYVRLSFSRTDPVRKEFISGKRALKQKKSRVKISNFNACSTNAAWAVLAESNFREGIRLKPLDDLYSRQVEILKSVKAVDDLHLYERRYANYRLSQKNSQYKISYEFPVLFLVIPWINRVALGLALSPPRKSVMSQSVMALDLFYDSILIEQDMSSYAIVLESLVGKIEAFEDLKIVGHAQGAASSRVQACDLLSMLHSSITHSPVLRLPMRGESVQDALRNLSPTALDERDAVKADLSSLIKLGNTILDGLNKDIEAYLLERDGPICIISDLPVEIANIQNVPLFFLKDVCRLPETSPESLLSEFMKNSLTYYSVSSDLLSKTLVVCCSPGDQDLVSAFNLIKSHVASIDGLGDVQFRFAQNIDELSSLIDELKPELLIIDTHGDARPQKLDSVLMVGDEILDSSEIIKRGISAPLVVLSSCLSAPLYGYISPLAHAFFQAGAFSVLSTTLPLGAWNANILYSRLLVNLKTALSTDIHDSWAGFISHNLRTSLFDDYKEHVDQELGGGWFDFKNYSKVRSAWQVKSLVPGTRVEAFNSLKSCLISLSSPGYQEKVERILKNIDSLMPNSYIYSLFGRADLIKMPMKNSTFVVLMDGP